jgi:hypothetical protein
VGEDAVEDNDILPARLNRPRSEADTLRVICRIPIVVMSEVEPAIAQVSQTPADAGSVDLQSKLSPFGTQTLLQHDGQGAGTTTHIEHPTGAPKAHECGQNSNILGGGSLEST